MDLAPVREWRITREAGFTEQRLPPSFGSGRITSRCHPGPHCQMGCSLTGPPLFSTILH
uniref:Uncharacterized protein n=1 Tax=Manihot esculenta TaxID=3983 RepID=A0A2C9VJ16_MANES